MKAILYNTGYCNQYTITITCYTTQISCYPLWHVILSYIL